MDVFSEAFIFRAQQPVDHTNQSDDHGKQHADDCLLAHGSRAEVFPEDPQDADCIEPRAAQCAAVCNRMEFAAIGLRHWMTFRDPSDDYRSATAATHFDLLSVMTCSPIRALVQFLRNRVFGWLDASGNHPGVKF